MLFNAGKYNYLTRSTWLSSQSKHKLLRIGLLKGLHNNISSTNRIQQLVVTFIRFLDRPPCREPTHTPFSSSRHHSRLLAPSLDILQRIGTQWKWKNNIILIFYINLLKSLSRHLYFKFNQNQKETPFCYWE